MSINYVNRSRGPDIDLSIHAPDISLLGYYPDNDYEAEDLDNWNRRSLMDKGPDQMMMPDDYMGEDSRRAQSQFSQSRLDFQYLGDDRYPQRNGELDLNDYSEELARGEDNGTMQRAVVKDSWDRIKKTQVFKRDAALTQAQGRLHPSAENEQAYQARLSALRKRQEFYTEKTNQLRVVYRPIDKNSRHALKYDPKRQLAVEEDMEYRRDEYGNIVQSKQKKRGDTLKRLHEGASSASFSTDSAFNKLRTIMKKRDLKNRSKASIVSADSENFDGDDNTVESLIFSQIKKVRKSAAKSRYSDDMIFHEEESKIAEAMRMFSNIKKTSAASTGYSGDNVFDEAGISMHRVSNKSEDKLSKVLAVARDNEDMVPDMEMEMAVREVARDRRRKSSFYHKACTRDDIGDGEDTIEENVRTINGALGAKKKRHDGNIDSVFDSDIEDEAPRRKQVRDYRKTKLGRHESFDNENGENVIGVHDSRNARRRKTRNDYYNSAFGGTENMDIQGKNTRQGALSKRGRNNSSAMSEDLMRS